VFAESLPDVHHRVESRRQEATAPMISKTRTIWTTLFFAYFFLVTVPAAHAYVDPGTGSYVFQVLVGIFLAAAVTIKLWWRRLWALITRKPQPKKPEAPARPATQSEPPPATTPSNPVE
jgi:hypothetical protein